MTTGTADIAEQPFRHFAGVIAPNRPWVRTATTRLGPSFPRYGDPFDPLELEAEFGHLNDQVVAFDDPEMERHQTVNDGQPFQGARENSRESDG